MQLITLFIVANTVLLATESYPQSKKISTAQEISNIVFYSVFLLEMIMKIMALGFKEYFSDRFNFFDAFVIFVSSIDIII